MAEIIIVMVIISIMAAFGIPSFTKSMMRAKARDANNNLTIIHTAQALYKANNGVYYGSTATPNALTDINTALSLSLVSTDGTNYVCSSGTTCVATAKGGAADFAVTVTLGSDISLVSPYNPLCSGTYCP